MKNTEDLQSSRGDIVPWNSIDPWSGCLLVLRRKDALSWAVRSTPEIPGVFLRAIVFNFWPADLWHPWPTFNGSIQAKKTNLFSLGFSLPSRRLNSRPKVFSEFTNEASLKTTTSEFHTKMPIQPLPLWVTRDDRTMTQGGMAASRKKSSRSRYSSDE